MYKYFIYKFLLLFSLNIFAIDLVCDKVDVDDKGIELPDSSYVEKYTTFKNLIPDQNQTYMDGETEVTIKWDDDRVIIRRESKSFFYITQAIISRKDFSWTGSTITNVFDVPDTKGKCKKWEKPKDNAF